MGIEGIPESLEWRSHPARERPLAAVALLVIKLAASWGAVQFGQGLWWGIIGFAMLSLAMWSFLTPTSYRLDASGAVKKSIFGTERRSWREVRSTVPDRWGILLSPFPQPSRLAKFRGLSIQFSPCNREDVIAFVQARAGSEPSA